MKFGFSLFQGTLKDDTFKRNVEPQSEAVLELLLGWHKSTVQVL